MGGITEVYRPFGKNLKYYDVNSLYPFCAKNSMAGHKCQFIDSTVPLNLQDLFYAKVKTNDSYLGLLPVRDKGLILPNGS